MTTNAEGHRQRLRERFDQSGFDGFHDHEVLELLLSFVIPRRDVKPIAKTLMAEFHSFSSVLDASPDALVRTGGIGPRAAQLLSMVPRLLDRYQQDRWKKAVRISSTRQAVDYLGSRIGTSRNEIFCIMALSSNNDLLAWEEIQRGSVNRAAVFPRLVVEAILKHRATAVILAHNHPGGDPHPSTADRDLTRKLSRILKDLDIVVHDHIIIAGLGYYSFHENGEMP